MGYTLIVLFGALQFFSYLRTSDLIYDAWYGELTRSLLEHGSYQFDFLPATLFPPGLPLILAFAWLLFGQSQAVMYHVMAVSTALGLAASFELLRRTEGRIVALISCLLLGSSVAMFTFATNLIFSDMPYFFVSMLTLLLAFHIDRSPSWRSQAGWIALCSFAIVMAVMIRSAGIALLAGGIAWIVVSFFRVPGLGWRRLRLFCVPLLLGLAAQTLWTSWTNRHEVEEWPVPGFPHSYFAQLKVKLGNEPQLGMATLRDVPATVGRNLDDDAVELVKLLTRKDWINPDWRSPVVVGLIALILIGLSTSLWRCGGQLHDWYFLLYELMYAVWPWNFEMRFLLPIVPLACLYLWRGGKLVGTLVLQRSRVAGLGLALGGACLTVASLGWAVQTHLGQAILSVAFWSLCTFTGLVTLFPRISPPAGSTYIAGRAQSRGVLLTLSVAALVLLAALVGKGVAQQLQMAHSNLHFDATQGVFYPSIEAAQWIKMNSPPEAVVMARKQDLVFYYTRRRVIWFPPSTDHQLLMDGIRRYHVSLIVVPDRDTGYWRPSDQVCFHALQQAYPGAFHLVHRGPAVSVFEVRTSG